MNENVAGFPMCQPVVQNEMLTYGGDYWSFRAYIVDDGSCQYAQGQGEKVACIIGNGINAMNSIFMSEIGVELGYERRNCYIDAEVKQPALGWMLKSTNTDPNAVMPFFGKWGVKIRWSKASWVN